MFSEITQENSEMIVLVLRFVMSVVGLGVAGMGFLVFRSNGKSAKESGVAENQVAGWVALVAFALMGLGVIVYAWMWFLR